MGESGTGPQSSGAPVPRAKRRRLDSGPAGLAEVRDRGRSADRCPQLTSVESHGYPRRGPAACIRSKCLQNTLYINYSFSMFETGVNLVYKFSIPDGRFALSGLISGIQHP